MTNIEYLKSLENNNVLITFKDGCCLGIKIVDTAHIEDGDDIAGEVLLNHCPKSEHIHHKTGTIINFKVFDIDTIVELNKNR